MKRKLKVHYAAGSSTEVPSIILKGKWLEKAGFAIGDYVEVECEGDKITLNKTEPPEWKETIDNKLKKLNKNQKAELLRMLRDKC